MLFGTKRQRDCVENLTKRTGRMGTMGRRLSGYKQKALGRQTLKYAFDVVPFSVGKHLHLSHQAQFTELNLALLTQHVLTAADVPAQYGKVSFVFQRGGSLQYTDAVHVDTERKAYWSEVLKLVGYRQAFLTNQPNSKLLKIQFLSACFCRLPPFTKCQTRCCQRNMF